MKTVPLKDDMWRVFLDTSEYRTLLDCAYANGQRSPRQVRLEMRLMAASLRVDTVSEIEYGQFERITVPQGSYWVAKVQGKDSTEREAETRPRNVFIPDDMMEEIHQYAQNKDISPDEQLFKCSKRTIQRDVKRSAENAATATENAEFEKISAHDLRRYFATHLLFRHEVPPEVVRVLGGWKSDEAMFEYLVLPDDVLFDHLANASLLNTSYDKLSRRDHSEKIGATAGRLTELLDKAEQEDVEDAADSVESLFRDIEHVTVDVSGKTDSEESEETRTKTTEERTEGQRSLRGFGEHSHEANGAVAALLKTYWSAVNRVSDEVGSRALSLWDNHIDFSYREWVQQSRWRRAGSFSVFAGVAFLLLVYSMVQVGFYIDIETWRLIGSKRAIFGLLLAGIAYLDLTEDAWEELLADTTGHEGLAEALTLRPSNWI